MSSVESSFAQLFSQSPFAGYTLADWLKAGAALIGGVGTTYGVWHAYRYSKAQIGRRLFEYLKTNEEGILTARKNLLRRLEFGETLERLAINRTLEQAFGLLKSARVLDAQVHLEAFQRLLTKSSQIGERHRDIANRQAATVLLFMGIIAIRNNQTIDARKHFERALNLSKSDAEIMRWSGSLEFKLGQTDDALAKYDEALKCSGTDTELKAKVLAQRAAIYNHLGRRGLEKRDLERCSTIFAQLKDWATAANLFARLGELQTLAGATLQAQRSYRHALANYALAGNSEGADLMRAKLGITVPTRSSSRTVSRDLWQWLRLTAELAILLCGFFMLVSRT